MQENIPKREATRQTRAVTLHYVTIGERILAIRTERGLTQSELASASGLRQGLVSKYETGEQQPSIDSAKAIARAFRITLDELCGAYEDAGVEALRSDVGPLNPIEKRLVFAYRHDVGKLKKPLRLLLDTYAPKGNE